MRTIATPLHARVIGPQPTARLLQSPAFPDGEGDGQAMVRIKGSGPQTFEGPPGSYYWINGHVRATIVEVLPLLPIPNPATIPDDQSCALPVKLRYQRCGFPGWTTIDSDSGLCVLANDQCEIEVLVPEGWILLPTEAEVGEGFLWLLVDVWVTACPLPIGHTRGSRLTWFANLADEDVLVRPRRARTVQIHGPNAGGARFELSSGDPASAGSVPTGEIGVNGGFVNAPAMVGSASHMTLIGGGGVGPIHFSWEID